MAYKQNGWSAFTQRDPSKKLLKSEHKDTEITGGSSFENQADIEDRISFIQEDIWNQGDTTAQQKADLARLNKKLEKIKKKKKK
jgi:hypothetical protein